MMGRDGFRSRCLASALIALVVSLTVAAAAQGWRRPSDWAISSPSGGVFKVCRDGIKFQLATEQTSPEDTSPPPTEPFTFRFFTVYAPPPVLDENDFLVGGRIVLQGTITLKLQKTPFEAGAGSFYWYEGTHTQAWPGGQLLQPAPEALILDAGGSRAELFPAYDIQDCLLFGPRYRARQKCICIREALGPAEFRDRYGKRHPMRRCIRERSGH